MLLWIIVGVAVLLFGLLCFFASRTWQVWHVILMFGVFALSFTFLILAAMVLRTQHAWRTTHDQLAQTLEQLQKTLADLDGTPQFAGGETPVSLPALKHALGRSLLHRGRVWRGVLPAGMQGNQFVLNMQGWGDAACIAVRESAGEEFETDEGFTEEGEGAPEPQAVPQHTIQKGELLYAFLEAAPEPDAAKFYFGDSSLPDRDRKKVCRIPIVFLGHFLVDEANDQTIRVTSVYPLSESQQQALQRKATWVLYENLPFDEHDLLPKMTPEELAKVFRRPPNAEPARWQATLQEYLWDGREAPPDVDDSRKWIRIKFTQATTVEVDATGDLLAVEQPYDSSGRAVFPGLRQNAPTQFQPNQQALFSASVARTLVGEGKAEYVEEPALYRRPLRDYDALINDGETKLDARLKLALVGEAEKKKIEIATAKARDQIAARTEILKQVREDLANYQVELEVIRTVQRELALRRNQQRQELSRLYRLGQGLRTQLGGIGNVSGR